VADRPPIARHLLMVEAHRPIGLPHRTVAGRPRIVPRRHMAVVVIEEAEHLPHMVVEAGRLRLTAEVVAAEEGDIPLLAAATAAIAN
jgi:hypothetical protein